MLCIKICKDFFGCRKVSDNFSSFFSLDWIPNSPKASHNSETIVIFIGKNKSTSYESFGWTSSIKVLVENFIFGILTWRNWLCCSNMHQQRDSPETAKKGVLQEFSSLCSAFCVTKGRISPMKVAINCSVFVKMEILLIFFWFGCLSLITNCPCQNCDRQVLSSSFKIPFHQNFADCLVQIIWCFSYPKFLRYCWRNNISVPLGFVDLAQ